jgi:hypothetical protein
MIGISQPPYVSNGTTDRFTASIMLIQTTLYDIFFLDKTTLYDINMTLCCIEIIIRMNK